jgi:SAM-dependent methyltransferase
VGDPRDRVRVLVHDGPLPALQPALTELGSTWDVGSYERGRPAYPPEVVDLLVSRAALGPDATVLDLGAGNGRLTRPLLERFARVIAVEPHDEMRLALEASAPQAEVLSGTAEEIPLAAGSVDAVFAGCAFHWFDAARALPEIARVLRPRGALALVWSRWARDASAWGREIEEVLSRHGSNPAARWRDAFTGTELFDPVESTSAEVDHDHDRDGILALVASISFIAALPGDTRRDVLDEVARILDAHGVAPRGERVPVPFRHEVAWTRRR